MYVDLDVHHGDGVEDAFRGTGKIVTLSFHVHEPGFYPGSGGGEDKGEGVYNVPVKRGTKAQVWEAVVKKSVKLLWKEYSPSALVLQCGCDGAP
jgi:acetoin utilization deacetylase AcuC-like enzyme